MLTFIKTVFYKADPFTEIRREARIARDCQVRAFLQAHASQLKAIPQKLGNKIIQGTLKELVSMLNEGEVTSQQLVIKLAQRVSQNLDKDYAASVMFADALEQARISDTRRKQSGLRNWTLEEDGGLPALFGVPISIKDLLHIKNVATTCGCSAKLHIQSEDSFIVKVLRKQGAIMLLKGNTPHCGKSIQCGNSLWGRTINPFCKERSTGGSSGGEAGLVATGCVPCGIGTDLGGSLRIPAQFCELVTLKSTNYRMQNKGGTSAMSYTKALDATVIKGVPGPICRTVDDTALVLRCMLNWSKQEFPFTAYNPNVSSCPFNTALYKSPPKKLRVGVLHQGLKILPATKASVRAVKMAQDKLRQAGYQIKYIEDIPEALDCYKINVTLNLGIGKQAFLDMLEGQAYQKQFQTALSVLALPGWLARLVLKFSGDPRLEETLQEVKILSYKDLLLLMSRAQSHQRSMQKLFTEHDLVLMPNISCAPFLHKTSQYLLLMAVYTMIWNICEFPAGTVPVTRILKEEQFYEGPYKIDKLLQENMRESEGLPVAVQVVGRPFEDELVLAAMRQIYGK